MVRWVQKSGKQGEKEKIGRKSKAAAAGRTRNYADAILAHSGGTTLTFKLGRGKSGGYSEGGEEDGVL